jgi:hypothetical protein
MTSEDVTRGNPAFREHGSFRKARMAGLAQTNGSTALTAGTRVPPGTSLFESPAAAVLIGLSVMMALSWPKLIAVWQTGAFFDTDDAMHMVQLRDWLAGQNWFDLTAHRLAPPQGVDMHWSRILEVAMAGLVKLFELFLHPDAAERLMRIVYPLALQGAFFAAVVAIARRLAGLRTIVIAVILAAFSFSTAEEFAPGRITHHSAQIVLLLFMLVAVLDVFEPGRAARAMIAGCLAALSLAISIENLPFIFAMSAMVAVAWVMRGAHQNRALEFFGGGLALGTLVLFPMMVPPSRYAADVCDAFSAAHLIAAIVGGAGFVVLGFAASVLPTMASRAVAVLLVAIAVVGAVAVAFPDCLADPQAGVDPLVRDVWLSNVSQARPLWTLLTAQPLLWLQAAMPIALGLAAAVGAACRERGDARARWAMVAGLIGIGTAGAFWELRVLHSVAPLAIWGGVWLFDRALQWLQQRARTLTALPFLLIGLFSPLPWSFAAIGPAVATAPPSANPDLCFAPAAFRALDTLPPGLMLAPIDAGPYILVFSHHSVLAAPYHRNNSGNRVAISAWLAAPEQAHRLLHARGVRYVAICPAATELWIYRQRAPGGFAAQLSRGIVPAWLRQRAVGESAFAVYRVE